MNVFRLVYCSLATAPLNRDELTDILTVARARNRADGITGVLCYAAPVFVQCLEGPQGAVSRTLGRIHRDRRHADLTIVDARFVPARTFPNWSMELIAPAHLPVDLVRRIIDEPADESGTGRLDTERVLNLLDQVALVQTPTPRSTPGRSAAGVQAHPLRTKPNGG